MDDTRDLGAQIHQNHNCYRLQNRRTSSVCILIDRIGIQYSVVESYNRSTVTVNDVSNVNQSTKFSRLVYFVLLIVLYCNRSVATVFIQHFESFIRTNPANVPVNTRSMSQRSITSFFNITPKAKEKKEIKDEVTPSPDTSTSNESTPVNGNAKRVKRSRSSSSETEVKREEPSPPTPEKKKKVKRQRIESSDSEAEQPSCSEDKPTEIKLEKSEQPKTYDSPKNKKSKAKPDRKIKVDKSDVEKKVKVEKKSPSPKISPKNDVKKSPASYFTVKAGKTDENSKSNGAKTDNIEDGEKDNVKKVAEVDYNPAKAKYHPIHDACWSKGQEIPYLALSKTLEAIEATSARLKMIEILSNYFRSVIVLTPEDLLPSIYLCLNQLAPAYHSLELGECFFVTVTMRI
ncbi:jg17221 [Pararge aegeria aegeria]|uniref:Jg17221 protein n=1 Tax=Pararge aegeria aegeria TaxID=348720 RepID=A0A8S4SFM9_9NEOP|nr:jg17221 [Pararge aegeria aegeria]